MKEYLPSSEIIIIIMATWLSKSWGSLEKLQVKQTRTPRSFPLHPLQMAETARENELLKPEGNRDKEN